MPFGITNFLCAFASLWTILHIYGLSKQYIYNKLLQDVVKTVPDFVYGASFGLPHNHRDVGPPPSFLARYMCAQAPPDVHRRDTEGFETLVGATQSALWWSYKGSLPPGTSQCPETDSVPRQGHPPRVVLVGDVGPFLAASAASLGADVQRCTRDDEGALGRALHSIHDPDDIDIIVIGVCGTTNTPFPPTFESSYSYVDHVYTQLVRVRELFPRVHIVWSKPAYDVKNLPKWIVTHTQTTIGTSERSPVGVWPPIDWGLNQVTKTLLPVAMYRDIVALVDFLLITHVVERGGFAVFSAQWETDGKKEGEEGRGLLDYVSSVYGAVTAHARDSGSMTITHTPSLATRCPLGVIFSRAFDPVCMPSPLTPESSWVSQGAHGGEHEQTRGRRQAEGRPSPPAPTDVVSSSEEPSQLARRHHRVYPLLVTGLGGAGTTWTARQLALWGMPVAHEALGEAGAVSWLYAVNDVLLGHMYPHGAHLGLTPVSFWERGPVGYAVEVLLRAIGFTEEAVAHPPIVGRALPIHAPIPSVLTPRFTRVIHLQRDVEQHISTFSGHKRVSFMFIADALDKMYSFDKRDTASQSQACRVTKEETDHVCDDTSDDDDTSHIAIAYRRRYTSTRRIKACAQGQHDTTARSDVDGPSSANTTTTTTTTTSSSSSSSTSGDVEGEACVPLLAAAEAWLQWHALVKPTAHMTLDVEHLSDRPMSAAKRLRDMVCGAPACGDARANGSRPHPHPSRPSRGGELHRSLVCHERGALLLREHRRANSRNTKHQEYTLDDIREGDVELANDIALVASKWL